MPIPVFRNWRETLAKVRSALMRRGRSAHEADDLVQEAWVRMAGYEGGPVQNPEGFLMRTALNLSNDAYAAAVVRGEVGVVEEAMVIELAPATESIAIARQRLMHLSDCLGRLTEKTRSIFLAHRLDGLSYSEIAEARGISVSAVEKHVAKATLLIATWMEGW